MSDERTAVPDTRAAHIAAISTRRLRYWEKANLVTPDVERVISPRNRVRLYSLPRVMELVIVSELRRQGVSLQHIRQIVEHLRQRGYEAPLREVRFALSGALVMFQHADGTWEDTQHPFQGVMSQVIDLKEIRARVVGRLKRPSSDAGIVEKRRKVQASKPVFRGTRVPVEALEGYLMAGTGDDEILEAFPSLTKADIEVARAQMVSVG